MSRRPGQFRGLGFVAAPVVPPVDPFTIAVDIGAMLALPLIGALRGKEHLDANKITPRQNEYHQNVLAPAVTAKDDPTTPVEDLVYWDQQLRDEGEKFFDFASQFQNDAGRGAIRTIFGEQDATGQWITTSNAPGYATQILADLERIIEERTGMRAQLGIDWGKLVQIGVQTAATLTNKPVNITAGGGSITATPPTTSRPYSPYPAVVNAVEAVPGWAWGLGAIAAVGLVLALSNRK